MSNDTKSTETTAYVFKIDANASDQDITRKLHNAVKSMLTARDTFAGLVTEAFNRDVHRHTFPNMPADKAWAKYIGSVLDGFKPDTDTRRYLSALMRANGVPDKAIAEAVAANVRTLARDKAATGQTDPNQAKRAQEAASKVAAEQAEAARKANPYASVVAELATLAKRKVSEAKPLTPADVAKRIDDAVVSAYVKNLDMEHVARILTHDLTPGQLFELASIIAPPAKVSADVDIPAQLTSVK